MGFSSHYLLLFAFILSSSSSSTSSLTRRGYNTVPITVLSQFPYSDPSQSLERLASTSIARAHHLKNPQNATAAAPLRPVSGGYTVSLSFGTPPQAMPMIMDTGSSFSWFPCTKRYACKNCSLSSADAISPYIPRKSSTARIVGCMSEKCGWVHKSFDPQTSCQDCKSSPRNCTQICPPYIILYGIGSTGGIALVETLLINRMKKEDFLVGCSLFSSNQPAGVAGFGRGVSSLPNQLGVKRFSYCLVSHRFDNSPKSSSLFMDTHYSSGAKSRGFSYTPLLKTPSNGKNSALSEYYYVGLKKITVGGKKVRVSREELSPDNEGNGGTIVDSGSTFTYMNKKVYDAVGNVFSEQVKEYIRAEDVETLTGLKPCFDVSGHKSVHIPEMKLHFKGGAVMNLPLENYFFAVIDVKKVSVCLTAVTANTLLGPEVISGPSIILGNFFTQNFRVEFDLRNERLGFKEETCT